jgi:mxaA protein
MNTGMIGIYRLCLFTLFIIIGCSPSLQEPITRFEFQAPKPFGYVIGDEIHHRIIVETRSQLKLVTDSIPAKGQINRWLDLKQANIAIKKTESGGVTLIDLTYQVFYAPLEVKMLKIPGFTLKYLQNNQTIEQQVPAWHFTLSPLHELAVRKEDGQVYMRPDAQPGLIDNQQVLDKLYAALLVLIAASLYLAYLYGYLPGVAKRSIFKEASKQLAGLNQQEMETGLTIVHAALNTRYLKPLFQHKLNDFYREQPEFKAVAPQLDWFFSFSNQYFFSNRKYYGDIEFAKLKELCQLCRKIERGGL